MSTHDDNAKEIAQIRDLLRGMTRAELEQHAEFAAVDAAAMQGEIAALNKTRARLQARLDDAKELLRLVCIQGGHQRWTTREMLMWCSRMKDFQSGQSIEVTRERERAVDARLEAEEAITRTARVAAGEARVE